MGVEIITMVYDIMASSVEPHGTVSGEGGGGYVTAVCWRLVESWTIFFA